jgi:hypothetical protein
MTAKRKRKEKHKSSEGLSYGGGGNLQMDHKESILKENSHTTAKE